MELILSVAIGVGLAAAVGFRVFVPFTVISAAAMGGYLDLSPGFDWIGTMPALIMFSVATLVEIAAYYIPWVDNLLDTVATPVAVVAGAVITASVVGEMSPLLRWSLAAIAGGGIAGTVQAGTALIRGAFTLGTGGFGNFLVSTGELVGAILTALLAIWLPLAGIGLILLLIFWSLRHRIIQANARIFPS
jgi:hypothetical protein